MILAVDESFRLQLFIDAICSVVFRVEERDLQDR
jgi:hypothetical protein